MISKQLDAGVALLTLEHGVVNALDVEFLRAIEACFRELDNDPPKAVVLTGSGRAFSAGVDLYRLISEGPDYAESLLTALDGVFASIFDAPFPVVCALNGHAIAGGLVLACACDHRIMAEGKGRVGVPELTVGVPWPTAALEMVRYAYAPNRVQELVFLGRTYAAEDAHRLEFVDALVPADQLLDSATAIAKELGSIPADAFRSSKALLHQPTLDQIERSRPGREAAVLESWRSEETKAVIRGYLERTVGK